VDERGADGVEVHAVTADRLDDVADLFASNGTTRGCWCMYFIASRRDFGAGYRGGNREAFEQLATDDRVPLGLLAYREGRPVAWCAAGPRSRYPRVIGPRAKILARRDPAEDDDVWLVPCFFVRVGERGQGITSALLDAAVELAREHGATAVEGFPRSAGQPPSPDDFLGRPGGVPPGEPTPCGSAFVSAAEPAEQAKRDLDAASGRTRRPKSLSFSLRAASSPSIHLRPGVR
jgi:GNAT superfamily N-acetyltransferase